MILFYRVREPYGEFSNFARRPITVHGERWNHSEGFYQAMKREGTIHVEIVRLMQNPRDAAYYGRRTDIPVRPDWDAVKENIMMIALRAKFTQHDDLHSLLLSTGKQQIIEHSPKDAYWGDGGDGSGRNRLGALLMQLRDELRLTPNMYDELPCPACGRRYRFRTVGRPNVIVCDDCGHEETAHAQDQAS